MRKARFVPRNVLAYAMSEKLRSDYRASAHDVLPDHVESRLRRGIMLACCDYSVNPDVNDVFKRAASIGYYLVDAAGGRADVLRHVRDGLCGCVVTLLAHEGVHPLPPQDWSDLRRMMADALENCWQPGKGDAEQVGLRTFIALENLLAGACVCSDGNQKDKFKQKACHR